MTARSKLRKELGSFGAIWETSMVNSGNFRNATITLITTGFTGTIKLFASNQNWPNNTPDLSSAASTTNEYSVVQSINLQDGNTVDGNTWVAYTAGTEIERFEINDNNNNYIGAKVTAYTAGTVEIKIDLVDNQ